MTTPAGNFDITNFEVTKYFEKDISKPFTEYGTHAWNLALKEAVSRHDEESIPANLIVFEQISGKARAYHNLRHVALKGKDSIEDKIRKYKELKENEQNS